MNATKNIKHNRLWVLILLMGLMDFISPQNLHAQDSLSHYLVHAAQNNPSLKASYHQYQASLEMIPQVGALPDPDLSFAFFLKPKEELMGNQQMDVRVMQMFPWFGTLTASKNEAALMAKSRFQEFSEARNRLFFDMTTLYYQLYRLEKEKALAQKNLKYLKTYEQLSLIRFRAGSSAPAGSGEQSYSLPSTTNKPVGNKDAMSGQSQQGMTGQSSSPGGNMAQEGAAMPKSKGIVDVLRVQMDINDLENTLTTLDDQKAPLVAAFNAYLNRPVNSPVIVPDTLLPVKTDTTIKVLTDSIVANNPMLKMYASEQESYKARIEKSKLMGLPMFGLGLDYELLSKRGDVMGADNGKDMIMPMVNLKLPIFRKKYTAMQKESEYLMNASKNKQINTLNNLQVDLQNALLNLKIAERKITLFNKQSYLAGQSLNVLTTTYSTAGLDLEEVLRMQQKLLDYRFKLVEAIVDQNTGVANIEYLVSKKVVNDDYLKSNN